MSRTYEEYLLEVSPFPALSREDYEARQKGSRTIKKTFKTLKQAERYHNRVQNDYHYARLVRSPRFTEAGDYAWEVATVEERLEYLRRQLQDERISTDELLELQSLARHIKPGDVELAEAAGIPEEEFAKRT